MRGGIVIATYEYYQVDPGTWADARQLAGIDSASVAWDSEQDIKGTAAMECEEDLGECYVRPYLVLDGVRHPLGAWLCQTPTRSHDGRSQTVSIDAYSPLLELMDDLPPVGYFVSAGSDIVKAAAAIIGEHCHAPVIPATDAGVRLLTEPFVADLEDSWLSFTDGLLAKADLRLGLDEMGDVIMLPVRDLAALQPVLTLRDDDASIVMPDVTDARDLYGVPNVYEAVWSGEQGFVVGRAENDSPSSPLSTVCRGRDVTHRDTSPDLESPTQEEADAYAARCLRELSGVEHEITYRRDWVPGVRAGDCVLLDLDRSDVHARAQIVRQELSCDTECLVTETVRWTEQVWQ